MLAKANNLRQLFGQDAQYVVPRYQRPYVWTRELQWEPLWDDIVGPLDSPTPGAGARHFLGAVVVQQETTGPGELLRYTVIDGQQRMTTLQLLLSAAAAAAAGAGADSVADDLLTLTTIANNPAVTAPTSKLSPTSADREAYEWVVRSQHDGADPLPGSSQIVDAYAFFEESIRSWALEGGVDGDALTQRYQALRRRLVEQLQVVTISLESDDDPQVIFETLNARGTPLLAADLVKNALFHLAEKQGADAELLHDNVWAPQLGEDYWRDEIRQGRLTRPRSELFFMHWMAVQLAEVIPATGLFTTFRQRILPGPSGRDAETLVRQLARDSAILRGFDSLPPATREARFFRVLEALDTTTMFPVALALFSNSAISVEQRELALRAIESFLVRRNLLGLSTKAYNRIAAGLLAEIAGAPATAGDAIVAHLAQLTGDSSRWPRDAELEPHLASRGLYGWLGQKRIVLVLSELELNRRAQSKTESIVELPPKLSIEHVMPQQWTREWPLTDPDDVEATDARQARINLLGNLTLVTGSLNSSLSNQAWAAKRTRLSQHSLLLLNSELAAAEAWDEQAIDARGVKLTAELKALWPSPTEFDPTVDEEVDVAPEGELAPELAEMGDADLVRLVSSASDRLRELLAELARTPGDRRSYSQIEDALGWTRGDLAAVLGSYGATKAQFDERRPFHTQQDAGGTWWIWMDEHRAAVAEQHIPESVDRAVAQKPALARQDRTKEERRRFWQALLDGAGPVHTHSGVIAPVENWLDAGAGVRGLKFKYRVRSHSADVTLLFQHADAAVNERYFDTLLARRETLEARYGTAFRWDRKPGAKKCEVVVATWDRGLDDTEHWPELHREMLAAMARLADAVRPTLGSL